MKTITDFFRDVLDEDNYQSIMNYLVGCMISCEENDTLEKQQNNLQYITELTQTLPVMAESTEDPERRQFLLHLANTVAGCVELLDNGQFEE